MRKIRPAITLIKILVVIAILGLLVALLLPLKRSAREAARRNSCMNNLKHIALALLDYESTNGTFPPAYTVDADGNRLHSWRTLLLPYMEQSQLFETIDLSKPWDDPANNKARETVVEAYVCPSSPEPLGLTNYLAVVGPDFIFSDSGARKLSEVSDSPSATVMVVDVGTKQAVHWMSPHDASADMLQQYEPESRMNHPGIMLAACVDGHVHTIYLDIDKNTLQAMLTIAGGETITDD